jgi:hypothetical protein
MRLPVPNPTKLTERLGSFSTTFVSTNVASMSAVLSIVHSRQGYRNIWGFIPSDSMRCDRDKPGFPGSFKPGIITM